MDVFYENRGNIIDKYPFGGLSFLPHFHEQIELVYLKEGSTRVEVNFKEFSAKDGNWIIIFPNQIHSYIDTRPCSGHIFIFSAAHCSRLTNTFMNMSPVSPIISSIPPKLSEMILKEMLNESEQVSPYSALIEDGYLWILLGKLFQSMEFEPISSCTESTIKNVLTYCLSNYKEAISLDSLEENLHISKYHISHLFSQKMKISFSNYINKLRLNEASRLLKEGKSITDTSFESGFGSIRSFNRAFTHQFGVSPSEYKKLFIHNS